LYIYYKIEINTFICKENIFQLYKYTNITGMPMDPIVIAEKLVKVYKHDIRAVNEISFTSTKGITILMGPNGSGKTTTLSMIAGALKPTSGRVLINGLDLWGSDWFEARKYIGFAPQNMPFRDRLTLIENLVWYGLIRGIGISDSRRRGMELLDHIGLSNYATRPVGELSGGQRRKLSIAAALIGDPDILVLDEPTSGLDPSARVEFWSMLRDLARDKVVIASTHIAEDAEEYGNKVLVFHKGHIVAEGAPLELISKYAPTSIIIVKGILRRRLEIREAKLISFSEKEARYSASDPDSVLPELIETYVRDGSRIETVHVKKPGLYEVFLNLTGEKLDEG